MMCEVKAFDRFQLFHDAIIFYIDLLAACHAPTLWPIEWRVLPLVRCDWLLNSSLAHLMGPAPSIEMDTSSYGLLV